MVIHYSSPNGLRHHVANAETKPSASFFTFHVLRSSTHFFLVPFVMVTERQATSFSLYSSCSASYKGMAKAGLGCQGQGVQT